MVKKFVLVSIGVVIIFVVGFWVVSSWKNRGAVSVGGFLIKTNKIALISEVPGVSFVWKDEIGFNSYLDTLDFWGSKTVKDFSSPAILKADAKRMIIKLVKEVKDPFYVSSDIEGKVWDAIGESVGADGTVKIEEQIIDRYHTPPVNSIVLEMGDYPIVYDKRMKEGKINDIMLTPEIIQGTIEWFNLLHNQTDISIGYFVLDSETGEVNIKTREGWEIKADLLKRIQEQFGDFQFVCKLLGRSLCHQKSKQHNNRYSFKQYTKLQRCRYFCLWINSFYSFCNFYNT